MTVARRIDAGGVVDVVEAAATVRIDGHGLPAGATLRLADGALEAELRR